MTILLGSSRWRRRLFGPWRPVGRLAFCVGVLALLAAPASAQQVALRGSQFKVSPQNGTGGRPGVAFDGTNFLVVWNDPRNASTHGNDAYGTRVTRDGVVLDPDGIRLSTATTNDNIASVVFDGSHYVLVWVSGDGAIVGSILHPNGTVVATDVPITTTAAEPLARVISVAFDGASFLVVWRTTGNQIRGSRFSRSGGTFTSLDGPSGFPIAVNSGDFYPWVTFGHGQYLVAWHGWGTGGLDIFAARVTTTGVVLDPEGFVVTSAAGDDDHQSVTASGSNYLITFRNASNADGYCNARGYAVRVSPAGAVLDNPPIRIADDVCHQVPMPVVFDGTNYFVVWHVGVPNKFRLNDIMGRRISPSGSVLDAQPVPVATSYGHQAWAPVLGYGDGRFLAVWGDSHRESFCYGGCLGGQMLEKLAPADAPPDAVRFRPGEAPSDHLPTAWTQVASPVSAALYSVEALDNETAFATAESSPMVRYNGTAWSVWAGAPSTARDFGLWANAPDDVWAAGWGWGINFYNGVRWTQHGLAVPLESYPLATGAWSWGTNNTGTYMPSVLTVGVAGRTARHSEVRPNHYPVSTGVEHDLWDVWGTSATHAIAVGQRGTVLRWNGSTWSLLPDVPTTQSLNGVWGTSANDVFVVGDFGTILHYNGTAWSIQPSGTTEHLFAVAGLSATEIYAVGFRGTILRYNGVSWSAETSGTTTNLLDVAAAGDTIWAVGDSGTILRQTVPPGTCSRSLSAPSVSMGAGTGSRSVTLTTNCSWRAWSSAPWIRLTSTPAGFGDATIGVSVDPNAAQTPRTGTVTIAGLTLTVNQAASSCTYVVAPLAFNVPPSGTTSGTFGAFSVSVTTDAGCEWRAAGGPNHVEWLHVFDEQPMSGSGTVRFSVGDHYDGSPNARSHTFTVADRTVTVNQVHQSCTYTIDPQSRTVGAAGGGQSVNVGTAGFASCAWMAFSNDSWLTMSGVATGENAGTVSYTVAPNPGTQPRTGTINVAGLVHTVVQNGAPCTFSVNPTSAMVGSSGGPIQVNLTTSANECGWQANSGAAWLTVAPGSGQGGATLTASAAPHASSLQRSATLTIAGLTVTVTQSGVACGFTVTPVGGAIAPEGGTFSLSLSAGAADCAWQAVSDAAWLNVTPPGGQGSATIGYTVAANPSSLSRSATLTIAGLVLTVAQSGVACAFSVTPASAAIGGTGGTVPFAVNASPADCGWDASSPAPWLSVSPATGAGNATVNVAAAANPIALPRTGTVTIAGAAVTLTQGPALTMTPTQLAAEVGGLRVRLTWLAPTDGPPAIAYQLEVGSASGRADLINVRTSSAATLLVAEDAVPGTYYLRVRAITAGGISAPSNEVRAVIVGRAAPLPPEDLRGEAVGSSLLLTWRNSAVGDSPTGAVVDVTGAIVTSVALPVGERFSHTAVPPGVYTFTVRATNSAGSSARSNAVTLTFPAPCVPPQAPTNLVVTRSGSVVSASWSPPASSPTPTGYLVQVTGSFVGAIPTTATSLSASAPTGSYTIGVAATNACGTGPAAPAQTILIP